MVLIFFFRNKFHENNDILLALIFAHPKIFSGCKEAAKQND